jgi:hypothetical protein
MSQFEQLCNACKAGNIEVLENMDEYIKTCKYGMGYLVGMARNAKTARFLVDKYDINSEYLVESLFTTNKLSVAKYLREYIRKDIPDDEIVPTVLSQTTSENIAYLFDSDSYGVSDNLLRNIRPMVPGVIDLLENHVNRIKYMPRPNMYTTTPATKENMDKYVRALNNADVQITTREHADLVIAKFTDSAEDCILNTRYLHVAKYIIKKYNVTIIYELNEYNPEINRYMYKKGMLKHYSLNDLLLKATKYADAKFFVDMGANNIDAYFMENLHHFMEFTSRTVYINNYLHHENTDYRTSVDDDLYIKKREVIKEVRMIKHAIELGVKATHLPMSLCGMLLDAGCGIIINYMPKLLKYGISEPYIYKREQLTKKLHRYLRRIPHVVINIMIQYMPY